MTKRIRKAVFPVAGLGTRFLPATKSIPKEMLTLVDRPVLQHVVEEAREAGIKHFIFVTGRNKAVIEDHFDIAYELEETLQRRGKLKELSALRADLLPDMVTMPASPAKGRCLAQCMAAYEKHGGNIIAVEEVPEDETHQYGVVSIGKDYGPSFEITGMVEKPPKGTAPSNLIITGRYILDPAIFSILEKGEKGAGGEIQLTDGMKALAKTQPFHGVRFEGKTYDCGAKPGFLSANLAFALADPALAPSIKDELRKIAGAF